MPHPIYRAFVSSTFLDLAPERRSVVLAINNLNDAASRVGIALIPIDLRLGADSQPALDVCLREVRSSDLMITLVGGLYGSETPEGISYTEAEYDAATAIGTERFAYYKDGSGAFLPEQIEDSSIKQAKLDAFRRKIDGQLKRDLFGNADELRGHVIRDLLRWLLQRPEVVSSMSRMAPATAFPGSKAYFDAINRGDTNGAADVALSRDFTRDMERHGLSEIHHAILADLLGLGRVSGTRASLSHDVRGRVLLRFVRASRCTIQGATALREARDLVGKIQSPHYTYEVVAEELMASIEAHRFDLAEKHIERMLQAAGETRDIHTVAQAHGVLGEFFASQGNHLEALKWHWEEIDTLCKMPEICPFCLSDAFRHSGNEHMALGDCVKANDRFGKSLMVARSIPDRVRQIQALHFLARHWAHHQEIRPAVAGYVLLARIAGELDPTRDDSSLSLLLGEMTVEHGQEAIGAIVRDVEGSPQAVVDEALAPYKISDFVSKLGLKPNHAGEH